MIDFSVKTTSTSGTGDHRWLRTKNVTDWTVPVTIDRSKLTAGTHYDANGVIPAGLPLGKILATGKYAPFDATATDGRQVLAGFLVDAKQLQ